MKKVAIDLTWVRHNKVGGTESSIRNLLDGFVSLDTGEIKFVLLVTKDNVCSFKCYETDFLIDICDVKSANQIKRAIWQNTKMGRHLKKNKINVCLEPVYGKPFFGTEGIEFFTTIHDLQALHYPRYFNMGRVLWMKKSWENAIKTSKKIIAISNYVKQDIENNFPEAEGKVEVIYDAVSINIEEISDDYVLKQVGVEKNEYYYTVSSLLPHKNLSTLIQVIAELKRRKSAVFYPLVISGIGGKERGGLERIIGEYGIDNDILFTPFVSNGERNVLYKNCRAFLYSSVFEGFGMPPLEAAIFDAPVLTTKCTSIAEITGGLLNYVDHPMESCDWIKKLESGLKKPNKYELNKLMDKYNSKVIAQEYLCLLGEIEK